MTTVIILKLVLGFQYFLGDSHESLRFYHYA